MARGSETRQQREREFAVELGRAAWRLTKELRDTPGADKTTFALLLASFLLEEDPEELERWAIWELPAVPAPPPYLPPAGPRKLLIPPGGDPPAGATRIGSLLDIRNQVRRWQEIAPRSTPTESREEIV